MKDLLREAFRRRPQALGFLPLLPGFALFLIALAGGEYGAFPPYATLALICFVQFYVPTLAGWAAVLLIQCAGAAVYVPAFLETLEGAIRGTLGPADDLAGLGAIAGFFTVVGVAQLLARPRLRAGAPLA